MIKLEIACVLCGNTHSVMVKEEDYTKYLEGELVQKAFPYLNATQREQIISGLCPRCQEDIFGTEEE